MVSLVLPTVHLSCVLSHWNSQIFVRISCDIFAQFTRNSHQVHVHKLTRRMLNWTSVKAREMGAVKLWFIKECLFCGTPRNIFLEFLGTELPCKRDKGGDFMAKHGHIHTRFDAHSKGPLSANHKGHKEALIQTNSGDRPEPASSHI